MNKILIVDDFHTNIDYLINIINDYNNSEEIEFQYTTKPKDVVGIAKEFVPNLIILDIVMPEMNGYEVCKSLKNNETTKNISILFITSKDITVEDKIKILNVGGDAFILRPFEKVELLTQVRALLKANNAQVELFKSEETFRSIYNTSTEAIFIQNIDGIFIDVNQGAVNIFGYSKDEFIGKTFEFIGASGFNDYDEIREKIAEAYKGTPQIIKFFGLKKDGSVITKLISLSKGMYFGQKVVLAFSTDITEIEKIKLQISKENKFKNTLLSILSHDLRSPFNSILGFSELISESFHDFEEEEIIDMADNITKTSKRTLELITNLLEWAKIQANRYEISPELINVESIIDNEIDLQVINANLKNITISKNIDSNSVFYADERMISTVVRNLLSNAIKFTPIDGEINIISKNRGTITELKIKDNGIGISREDISKLYGNEMGFSTLGTQKEKGSGLGLVICKEFVEKNGGELILNSVVGKGTEFKIKLPSTIE